MKSKKNTDSDWFTDAGSSKEDQRGFVKTFLKPETSLLKLLRFLRQDSLPKEQFRRSDVKVFLRRIQSA